MSRTDNAYWVYILASKPSGVLYIGVTGDLVRRVWEHKQHQVKGFTQRYNVDMMVHYESFTDPVNAIAREKQLKKWNRAWKVELIETANPAWRDLYEDICR